MTTYKETGVNISQGQDLVKWLKKSSPLIGGFGGAFPLGENYLVSGTDGVGTKLRIAAMVGKHDTVGIDLVAMCVNDIICMGAKPLFFLDYYATGRLDLAKSKEILRGVIRGCEESGAVLIGGETAEMPGFYGNEEYDLAGFAVGIVKKERLIDGSKIRSGNVLVGIPSSGLHSNGFSLIRKVLIEDAKLDLIAFREDIGCKLSEELLKPTKIYTKMVLKLLENYDISGICHITGGSFYEKIPRIFPPGLGARIQKNWKIPRIFSLIQELGKVPEEEMFRTFNMGIGLVLICDKDIVESVKSDTGGYIIGEIISKEGLYLE